jgi:cold-inducible RNA-binding protein
MKLFISDLPFTLTEAELRLVLENFGAVSSLMLAVNRQDGKSRGFAFAEMEEDVPGTLLERLNSVDFSGKKMYAALAVDKEAYRPRVLGKKKRKRIHKMMYNS